MSEVAREKRRGAILKHLTAAKTGELTPEMLASGCTAQGVPTNIDQAVNAAKWLEGEELAELVELGGLTLVRILPDGREWVRGVRDLSGILDPDARG
ncbi:MAG: hypothetical protein AAGM84_05545 [Pseudomonadota bacterium]